MKRPAEAAAPPRRRSHRRHGRADAFWHGADALARWCAYAGIALLFAACVITVLDVLTRRSINWSVPGLVDLTQLLVMGCVFLVIPYTFLREANVDVDFATNWLSPRALAWLKALIGVCGSALMLAFTWYSWLQAAQQIDAGDKSQTIAIPYLYFWAPLLFGCLFGAVFGLVVSWRHAIIALGHRDVRAAHDARQADAAETGR